MIIQVLHCSHCQGTDIVRHGKSPEGKQRYRCRQCREGRGRTFLLDYAVAYRSLILETSSKIWKFKFSRDNELNTDSTSQVSFGVWRAIQRSTLLKICQIT